MAPRLDGVEASPKRGLSHTSGDWTAMRVSLAETLSLERADQGRPSFVRNPIAGL
jgi:hypothetical protein